MKKVYFYNNKREKLVGVLHRAKKKTDKGIIICHGFKGNKDRDLISKLADKLSKKFVVLRFDFSGNGESEGKFEDQSYSKYIKELKIAIDYLKRLDINEIIVIGHSLGANIIALEQNKYKNINKIILLAPALFININVFIKQNLFLKYINLLLRGYFEFEFDDKELCMKRKERLNRKFFLDILLYKPQRIIKKLDVPLKLILGEKDEGINPNKTIKLYNKLKMEKSLTIISGAKHNFREEKHLNKLIKEILKWLE